MEQFLRAHIIEYKKYLIEDKSLKYSSINRKIAALSIYENFLIEQNIRKNDTKLIKKRGFYKIDRPYITSDMLPKETIKKVRLKAGIKSKRDYAMLVILDEGGLRVSELIKLEIQYLITIIYILYYVLLGMTIIAIALLTTLIILLGKSINQ